MKIRIMNKILILSIVALFCWGNSMQAQAVLKYKDVFEVVQNSSYDQSFDILSQYQKQDPYFANAYYHLSRIAFIWAQDFDPVVNFSDLGYFTYHANLYLTLCQKYFDDKEAKKNWELYNDVKPTVEGKRVEYEVLLNEINSRLKKIKEYNELMIQTKDNYFNAIRNYNYCLSHFQELVENNGKLKDIYLTATPELIDVIGEIGQHFDSTLIYLQKYRELAKDSRFDKHSVEYKLLPVETYRLEGLVKTNFLEENITLWDFKKWSDDVIKIINNDIKNLRADIDKESDKVKSLTNFVEITADASSKFEHYQLDRNLAFRIGRFDFKPLILDIINYNIIKLNLSIDIKNPINTGAEKVELKLRLLFYKELATEKKQADSLINELKTDATAFNILKYQDYITANYKDGKGLQNFIAKEPAGLDKWLDAAMLNLKNTLIDDYNLRSKNSHVVKTTKGEISLAVLYDELNDKQKDKYIVTSVVQNADADNYFCGYINPSNKNTKAFVAKCDSLYSLKWIKEYDFSAKNTKANNYACSVAVTEDGCAAVVHTRDTVGETVLMTNHVVKFNELGKEISKKESGQSSVPRIFIYDDLNAKIITAYKGTSLSKVSNTADSLFVEFADSVGNSIWRSSIEITGDLVELIRSNENILLLGNYIEMKDAPNSGKVSNKINAFMVTIDNMGNMDEPVTFDEEYSFRICNAVKLDSETLNLLGFKTSEASCEKALQKNDDLFYQIVNIKGGAIFKY